MPLWSGGRMAAWVAGLAVAGALMAVVAMSPQLAPRGGALLQVGNFDRAKAAALASAEYDSLADESAGIVTAALKGEGRDPVHRSPLESLAGFTPEKDDVEVEPVNLLSPDRTIQLPVAERADYRKSVYANALTACQTLRNRVGSCVIKSLNIKEQPDTKQPGFVRVSATARLAWLKHDGLSDDVIAGLDLQPNVPQTDVASADSDAPRLGPLATILNILQRAPETASAPPEAPKEGPRILRGGNAFRPAGDAAFRSVGGG